MHFKNFLSLLFLFCILHFSLKLKAQIVQGKAIYISDGDTFRFITSENLKLKIKIEGVDCPERRQPFGLEAKDFVMDKSCIKKLPFTLIVQNILAEKFQVYVITEKILLKNLLKMVWDGIMSAIQKM